MTSADRIQAATSYVSSLGTAILIFRFIEEVAAATAK